MILGDHDRRNTEAAQITLTIERVFIRQDFVKKTFNNDIALIKLNRDVQIVGDKKTLINISFRSNFPLISGQCASLPQTVVTMVRTPPWWGGASWGRGASQQTS